MPKSIYLIIFLSISFAAYKIIYEASDFFNDKNAVQRPLEAALHPGGNSISLRRSDHVLEDVSIKKSYEGRPRNFADVAIVADFMGRSGLNSANIANYISQYERHQLISLSEAGDMVATQALVDLSFSEGLAVSDFKDLIERAIVQGSLFELSTMFNHVLADAIARPNLNRLERRTAILEALAFCEFVRLRGGVSVVTDRQLSQKVYEIIDLNYPDNPVVPEELEAIRARGEQIYSYYQEKRHQAGLGDFDNELSPEVRFFYGVEGG